MDYKSTVYIDMSKYGLEGTIEVGAPTFRKRTELSNELSRQLTLEQTRTGMKVSEIPGGTWSVMQRLIYIRGAPFATDYNGFMAYMDTLDEQYPGVTDALWDDITAAVEKIDKGEVSPLEDSQGVETLPSA